MTAIKFCGLTQPEDAALAAELGAAFAGVIFAGGPRLVVPARAAEVLDTALAGAATRRVGVFGAHTPDEIADIVAAARLHVVQLHADPTAVDVERVRSRVGAAVWAVLRLEEPVLPDGAEALFAVADAVVVDKKVDGSAWGGTGVALDWERMASALDAVRGATPLVLAGGLRPENVAEAIGIVAPDVVDVSSGVEASAGIKDHDRMRRFAQQVAAAPPRGGPAAVENRE